jgi:hypothetical protein
MNFKVLSEKYQLILENQENQSNDFEFYFWKIYPSSNYEINPNDLRKYWTDYFNSPEMKELNPKMSQDLIDQCIEDHIAKGVKGPSNQSPTQIEAFNHMTFNQLFNGSAYKWVHGADETSQWKMYKKLGGKYRRDRFVEYITNNKVVAINDWEDYDGTPEIFASRNYKALITTIYNFYNPKLRNKEVYIKYEDEPRMTEELYRTDITFLKIVPHRGDSPFRSLFDVLPPEEQKRFTGDDSGDADSWKSGDDNDK